MTTRSQPQDRFVELFADEAETRLRRISEQVLTLEAGASADVVAAILRDAHSLKGAAAVVGLTDVSAVAHHLEDVLEPYRDGGDKPPASMIDRLLYVVDGLQGLLPSIRRRENTEAVTADLVDHLESMPASPPTATAPSPNPAPVVAAEAVVAAATVVSAPVVPATPAPSPSEMIELPASRVDEIVRSVGESAATNLRLGRVIGEHLDRDPESLSEYRDLTRSIRQLHEKAVHARMVPVGSITGRLHRAVRDVARANDKHVDWEVVGDDTELDRAVLQQLTDPLLHIVRNAVDHGIESVDERRALGKPERAVVRFVAQQIGSDVVVSVADDGRGIDVSGVRAEAARHGVETDGLSEGHVRDLIFRSGFSTAGEISETSGRGVGLDVVRASIERLRGRIEVLSNPGAGTEFRITVPVTAAVLPCLLVDAGGQRFALPMACVVCTQAPDASTITRAQGGPRVWVGPTVVPLASLAARIGLDHQEGGPIVVLAHGERVAAYQVNALVGQRDVMVTSLGAFVPQLPFVAGAAIEADGSILMVLNGGELAREVHGSATTSETAAVTAAADVARVASVLVADDALPVRELQRSILEDAGYRVVVAEDGAEALAALARDRVDLVLTDVDMPRMNGFELTRAIRAQPDLANLPVVIVSSKGSSADQQEGLDAGADAYIVKEAFGEGLLLSAVQQLLGRAS
jgi:two-component system chemotaxis sensor kinase CheA